MVVLTLNPLYSCSSQYSQQTLQVANPPLTYNPTSGTPTAQGIVPPFTNLPAVIYSSVSGQGSVWGWEPANGSWALITATASGNAHGNGTPMSNSIPTTAGTIYIQDDTGSFWAVVNGAWLEIVA